MALALAIVGGLERAHAQAMLAAEAVVPPHPSSIGEPCKESGTPAALRDAFRLVCAREAVSIARGDGRNVIVIGFVGGFVKRDDPNHPEVLFSKYLKERYGPDVHTDVFANHDGKNAVREVLRFLDSDGDGSVTAAEKEQAEIIVFGHSWGGSEAVTIASELGRRGIPVALTIQIDSVRKPGQHDRVIPANVAKAVNFYERQGLTRGQPHIVPQDAARTKILGNFRMTYRGDQINCDNYKFLPRVLNRPHHEIENDPRVWEQIATLIDSEVTKNSADFQAVSHPGSASEK